MNKSRNKAGKANETAEATTKAPPPDGTRETIESIAMAIILALVFRSFVAEAFVIPTGSMAPTLVGRHKDVFCPECGHRYQSGASNELTKDGASTGQFVIATTCPLCRLPWTLDLYDQPNDASFSGDRIIVGKFAYDFADPKRWDVIVFKFPGNARDNYIKRLVGLPGETIRIVGGNIYAKPKGSNEFRIARKPADKLNVLLQPICDSEYISKTMRNLKWPEYWYSVPPENSPPASVASEGTASSAETSDWEVLDGGHQFRLAKASDDFRWLRYRHLLPDSNDWESLQNGSLPAELPQAGLVTDFYAYNAYMWIFANSPTLPPRAYDPSESPMEIVGKALFPDGMGMHWVDDLAVDCDVNVQSSSGELALELIRGGAHHRCTIDLATGKAQLAIIAADGTEQPFVGDEEGAQEAFHPTASTTVKGPGRYCLRLSNVDHQMLLQVDGREVKFDQPTSYRSPELIKPYWSPQDPGDSEPALIGLRGGTAEIERLAVLRDKYYIATDSNAHNGDYTGALEQLIQDRRELPISATLSQPDSWDGAEMFLMRRTVEFEIADDAFFPLGDNSPQSQDARVWANPYRRSPLDRNVPNPLYHFVDRDLLVGKAMIVYWPHAWNRPFLWPNFSRMKWIR